MWNWELSYFRQDRLVVTADVSRRLTRYAHHAQLVPQPMQILTALLHHYELGAERGCLYACLLIAPSIG